MKKRSMFGISFLAFILITGSFLINALFISKICNHAMEDEVLTSCALTTDTIANNFGVSVDVPISFSEAMASDTLLRSILETEPQDDAGLTDSYIKKISSYLASYQEKYRYSSLFLVSAKSGRYYHQDGLNRVLTKGNPENTWYYDFLSSDADLSLDVDNDEANNNVITLFIDCRIRDESGNTIGVVGVGMDIRDILGKLEKEAADHKLSIYVVSNDGKIQLSSDPSITPDSVSLTDVLKISASHYEELCRALDTSQSKQGSRGDFLDDSNGYLSVSGIPGLNWTIVTVIDTATAFDQSFHNIRMLYILLFAILLSLIFLILFILRSYQKKALQNAYTDRLTGLYNRSILPAVQNRHLMTRLRYSVLLIMDVDDFKTINDQSGHTAGDSVLQNIAAALRRTLGKNGTAIRWGGDEFVAAFRTDFSSADHFLTFLRKNLSGIEYAPGKFITVSIGCTLIDKEKNIQQLISEADQALYISKGNGKNQTSWFSEQ